MYACTEYVKLRDYICTCVFKTYLSYTKLYLKCSFTFITLRLVLSLCCIDYLMASFTLFDI